MKPLCGGIAFGLAAVLAWAIYNVGVALGHQQGFTSADLTLLRYAGGAAVMLPLLTLSRANPFTRTTPWRVTVLFVLAGPPFAWVINTGFRLAPLSHAVVISPGTTMLVASALTRLSVGVPIPMYRSLGMMLLMLGLLIIASDQSIQKQSGLGTWAGDLCFVASGTLWGAFTWLMSHWKLDAVRTTGLIAIVSAAVYVPLYTLLFDPPQIAASMWLEQFAYQGLLGGALAVVFFAASVTRLGGGAAAVFPALVPPVAVLCAIPMTGQLPNLIQFAGLCTATAGLLLSLDLLGGAFRRRFRGPDRVKDRP